MMIYFKTGEVATIVGVSKRTLQKWLNQNKVPSPQKADNGYYLWSNLDIQAVQSYKSSIQLLTHYHFGGQTDEATANSEL